MQTQTLHAAAPQPIAAEGTGRLDLYAGIHKALRLFMTRTLMPRSAAPTLPTPPKWPPRWACSSVCSRCANCT